jgi:hypothetical protein
MSTSVPVFRADIHHTVKYGPLSANQLKLLNPRTVAMIRDSLVYNDPPAMQAVQTLTSIHNELDTAQTLRSIYTTQHH